MSLWQTFHRIPGDPTISSGYAWIDAGHSNAFADLGNMNFTVELWIKLTASLGYIPHIIVKGHDVPSIYGGSMVGGWGIDIGSMYWPTEDHVGISMGFWVAGKYFVKNLTYPDGVWMHALMSLAGTNHPQSWYLNTWRHIAVTAQRVDYSHWWDMIIYQDGYRASYDTTSNNYGLQVQGLGITTDAADDVMMDVMNTPPAGGLPYTHQSMDVGWTRISNIARYPTDGTLGDFKFTPTPRLTPPTPDGNTLGLWYFNEGSGVISHNQQGDSARDMIIYDGIWDGNVLTLNT